MQPSLTAGSTESTPVSSWAGMTRMTRMVLGPAATRKESSPTGAMLTVCRTHSGTSTFTNCGAAPRAVALDQGQQVAEVAGDRRLAQQDPHAKAALLQRLFEGERLVVGADARRDVGVERGAADARCVAVDVRGQSGLQLGQLAGPAGDDTWEVHHLRYPDRALAPEQALDVACRERPPR